LIPKWLISKISTKDEVLILRQSLLENEEDALKKAAIGNRVNEVIVKSIQIVGSSIDELKANHAETLFFKINNLLSK
jgi:SM-20-related protein